MSQQMNIKSLFRLGALIGAAALSSLAGCGEGIANPTDSVSYALTGHTAGPYGSTSGTMQPSGNHTTAVTRIVGYSTSAYVFGIKLFWGTESAMYGDTQGIPGDEIDLTDDPVYRVQYVVSGGILRGIKFHTVDGRTLELGLTPSSSTAFNNPDAVFTDLQTWQGIVSSKPTIWGVKFSYVTS